MAVVSVPVWYHPRGWIMVPITMCGIWNGNFILNTFRPRTTISAVTATMLDGFKCLNPGSRAGYLLPGVIVGGAPLPDLEVTISVAATALGVDGMLGLNFLKQFTLVQFDVEAGPLTLEMR